MRHPPGVFLARESIISSFWFEIIDADDGILSMDFIGIDWTGEGIGSGFGIVSGLFAAFLLRERGFVALAGLTGACGLILPYNDGAP